MTTALDPRTRGILAGTLPLMEQHRARLEEGLARAMGSFERSGRPDPSAARPPDEVRALADMLLGHARQLSEGGAAAGLIDTARQHHEMALGAQQYSAFGDNLKPVMQDVLGRKATPSVVAAWTDTYWAIVRMLFRQDMRLAA